MLGAWVDLCGPMAEITSILNSSSKLEPKAVEQLSRLDAALQAWYQELPADAACDESHLTDLDGTAYGLLMQFYKVQILRHTSPFPISGVELSSGRQTFTSESTGKQSPVVYENCVRIARLLLTYRHIFGVENIPSIMLDNVNLAAMHLAAHLLRQPVPPVPTDRDVLWLRLLVDTMESIQVHFPIAKRMIRTLSLMVDGTHLADIFGIPRLTKALEDEGRCCPCQPISVEDASIHDILGEWDLRS